MERISESELKVMDLLWQQNPAPARDVADALQKSHGWNKNTSYTLLKRLIEKGLVERTEPGFVCLATVSREAVQRKESGEFLDRLFAGSASQLFAALVDGGKLKKHEVDALRKMIDEM